MVFHLTHKIWSEKSDNMAKALIGEGSTTKFISKLDRHTLIFQDWYSIYDSDNAFFKCSPGQEF